jgi:hypothetical protein
MKDNESADFLNAINSEGETNHKTYSRNDTMTHTVTSLIHTVMVMIY